MSSFAAGKEWLVHTAANMAASMAASRRFLTAAAAQRLDTVLSAGNLWPLGLVFAGWALVRVVGVRLELRLRRRSGCGERTLSWTPYKTYSAS